MAGYEQNIQDEHRYIIQLSVNQDSFFYNFWDYMESVETLEEAERLCIGLYDKSIHKMQISDLHTNSVLRTWCK